MYEYRISRLHGVVDGDTIDVDIDLGFDIYLYKRIRLAGIDAPEVHTSNAQEKQLGIEAKDWLIQQLNTTTTLRIQTEKPNSSEKYGRVLGWLFIGDNPQSINQTMIEKGYAWAYLGDEKVKDFAVLAQRRQAAVNLA